jgi:predicted ATPase/DNA-binding CsgD family transcriptional regulator
VARVVPGVAEGGVHGFAAALTSFVGRAGEVREVAGLLAQHRLVTVTGPGGMGKTRLAGEVACLVAGRFADGVWLAELAAAREPALVRAAVAVALGVRQAPGLSEVESLTEMLARRQLLLVLDNCEHVLVAAAELCAAVLAAADDVRILATSREPLRVAGEARYRLGPLTLPPLDGAAVPASEAVALFADRARQVDPRFTLGPESAAPVARLVRRLDGMPLAIELAAARVEALGVAQLADRLDDRFALLGGGDRLAADRQRSLAAAARWSYELLTERERRVFRMLAVFPGPFTLEAAEAVAGADAGPAVLHLVDCSLLTPPRAGPDGRARYLMLQTLCDYGKEQLIGAGEEEQAAAALARFALGVAESAAAQLETSAGEVDAARWLDAEDATGHFVLAWSLRHDPATAVRLAIALAHWWLLRGRWAVGYELVSAAAAHATEGGLQWCAAQFWLGLMVNGIDTAAGLRHFEVAAAALRQQPPSRLLCLTLSCRAWCLANLGRTAEADEGGRYALALARDIGDPAGEAHALTLLAMVALDRGEPQASLTWCLQARRLDPAGLPGWIARERDIILTDALLENGELPDAERACAAGLEAARQAGARWQEEEHLLQMAQLDLLSGRVPEARAHLREAADLAVQWGGTLIMAPPCLDLCGHLCAQTGRPAAAVTAWAAHAVSLGNTAYPDLPYNARRREGPLREARQALGPSAARAAEERGAAMGPAAAAEYVALLVAQEPGPPAGPSAGPGLPRLSARERELVTLVAQGRTNTQIAEQLFISVRTVSSHLDRIRDKTGCRRRADLTRLALQAGLV